MGQIWVDIEQEFVDYDEVKNDKIIEFKSKYKEIDKEFDGELLKRISSNKLFILGEQSFQIDSKDLVGKKLARARFFSDPVSSEGDVGFGWGSASGFPEEFYSDLYKLLGETTFCASVTVSGDDGYYSGIYYTLENGIMESFTYYAPEKYNSDGNPLYKICGTAMDEPNDYMICDDCH